MIIILLVCFTIPATAFILLQNKKIQTYLASEITRQVSENLQVDFQIESVDMILFNRLVMKEVLLKDQYHDTLVYSPRLIATLKNYSIHAKRIMLSKLKFDKATVRLAIDTNNVVNLQFIIDILKQPKDSLHPGWDMAVSNIEFEDSRFLFRNYLRDTLILYGLNFTNIELKDLNADLRRFQISRGTVTFAINSISFNDKSGFNLDNMNCHASISKTFIHIDNAELITRNSAILADRLYFDFNDYEDFAIGSYSQKVHMNFSFRESDISFLDLSYCVPRFQDWQGNIHVSGQVKGKVNNLKVRDISLQYGNLTSFSGNFDLIGLPDIRETFMFFDIHNLATDLNRLNNITFPGKNDVTVKIPERLVQLGRITYTGNFTGFINDFVTYGKFTTDLGRIASDISIKPDSAENIGFRGKLKTDGFDLGKLLNYDEMVGLISMDGLLSGVITPGGEVSANMDGAISALEFNNYNYRNIDVSGRLSKNTFNGSFSVEDPNLRMQFDGKIDNSGTVPVFDFTSEISRARLYALNLSVADPTYTLSCLLQANFTGRTLDEYNGSIKLLNSLFQKQDKQIQIYDLVLEAIHHADTNKLLLTSGFVDAEISGDYEFTELIGSAGYMLHQYFPGFSNQLNLPAENISPGKNRFFYQILFKDTYPVTEFFLPELEIAPDTRIKGFYSPSELTATLTGHFPGLRYRKNLWTDMDIDLFTNDSLVSLTATSDDFITGKQLNLEKIKLMAEAAGDKMKFGLNWNNQGTKINRGYLTGSARYVPRQPGIASGIIVTLDNSNLAINDTLWTIHPGSVRIDSSLVELAGIGISHNDQFILFDGRISELPSDVMGMQFNKFDLKHINQVSREYGLVLDGILEGKASLSDIYENPLFLANLNISELKINEELLGETSLATRWINSERKIHLEAESKRGTLKTVEVSGDYSPGDKKIDFSIGMDKLRMNIIQPYLSSQISDITGIASGKLNLDGTIDQPEMNGSISLQKASFKINYLQTVYSFSDDISIRNNQIIFRNFEIFDKEGKKAVLDGTCTSSYLRNFVFDLRLEAQDFCLLNTLEKDNDTYYGTAIASGVLTLKGIRNDLKLNISAVSRRNTQIFIPLYTGKSISENTLVEFITSDDQAISYATEPIPSKKAIGLDMVFDLEMTPDAEVQIIFDPKVGDKLRGNGSGSVKLLINREGDFQMLGDYRFNSGDYLFTLQNIINKKLQLQPGGTIVWNGKPTDAIIDMRAIYSTKASPYILVPEGPEYLKKRLPVECHLIMTGNLMNPAISFEIVLPTAEEETKNFVNNAINTDEELTKQFLSLLVINNFSSTQAGSGTSIMAGSTGAGMAGVTTSELLSNQLSNWLSQISSDFDIGVNYRPGDEISTNQVEVALSTQILDDRVTIHTNVDVSGSNGQGTAQGTNTTSIAGEFDLEVKLTDDGKFRVKAFNHSNDDRLYKTSPYTQGVGFVFGEDFNTFFDLRNRQRQKADDQGPAKQ